MGTTKTSSKSSKKSLATKKSSSSLTHSTKHKIVTNGTAKDVTSTAVVLGSTTQNVNENASNQVKKKKDYSKKPRHKKVKRHQRKSERELLLAVLHNKKMRHFLNQTKQNERSNVGDKNQIETKYNSSHTSSSSSASNQLSQKKPAAKNTLIDLTVHRIRNIEYKSKSILRLASSHPLHHSILAISREGGSVELLDPNQKWRCVGIVEGMPSRSVDALTWLSASSDLESYNKPKEGDLSKSKHLSTSFYHTSLEKNETMTKSSNNPTFSCDFHKDAYYSHFSRRLFGASISDGTIFEIDFSTKQHINVIGSGGGAVFSLVALSFNTYCTIQNTDNNNLMNEKNKSACITGYIAAGCEDGCVRIYHVKDPYEDDISSSTSAGLELMWTLLTTGAPILSLAWKTTPTDNYSSYDTQGLIGSILYAGVADGTIRRYDCMKLSSSSTTTATYDSSNLRNGVRWKPSFRMTLETRGSSTPTQVWALQILSNNILISGDSFGQVQFWDANTGILMQSFQQNSEGAPVLDVVIDPKEKKVFASGVDSRVICIELVKINKTSYADEWVLTHAQRPHTHDVRGLAICGMLDHTGGQCAWNTEKLRVTPCLCSGSLDTKMCTYLIENFRALRPKRFFHKPFTSPISLAKDQKIMSVMRDNTLDLYKLKDRQVSSQLSSVMIIPQNAEADNDNFIGAIDIATRCNLICSDLEQDGSLLAVSDAVNLMLFQIQYINQEDDSLAFVPTPIKLEKAEVKGGCSAVKFFSIDNVSYLVCATLQGPIHVLRINVNDDDDHDHDEDLAIEGNIHLSDISVELEHTFVEHMAQGNQISSRPDTINQLVVSSDGMYLAAGRNVLGSNSIHVFKITTVPSASKMLYQHYFSLPALEAQHSSLQFSSSELAALVVGCVNNAFYIFEMESKRIGDWTKDAGFPVARALPKELVYRPEYTERIIFNPTTPSRFILGGYGFFCTVDLNQPIPKVAQLYPSRHVRSTPVKPIHPTKWRESNRSSNLTLNVKHENGNNPIKNRNFTICVKYNSMLFMDYIGDDEIVIVEQPWLSVVNALPDALERRVFGS